jgi:hypothetical protein
MSVTIRYASENAPEPAPAPAPIKDTKRYTEGEKMARNAAVNVGLGIYQSVVGSVEAAMDVVGGVEENFMGIDKDKGLFRGTINGGLKKIDAYAARRYDEDRFPEYYSHPGQAPPEPAEADK